MRRRGPWWFLWPLRWREARGDGVKRSLVPGCRGAVALIEAEAQLSAGSGAPGAGAAAGAEFDAPPRRSDRSVVFITRASVARCPCLCYNLCCSVFFFTLLSLADELLSAAARPVSRTSIGGENSLSASASKTLEALKKKKVLCANRAANCLTAVSRCAAAEIDTEILPAIACLELPRCVGCAK